MNHVKLNKIVKKTPLRQKYFSVWRKNQKNVFFAAFFIIVPQKLLCPCFFLEKKISKVLKKKTPNPCLGEPRENKTFVKKKVFSKKRW